MKITIQKSNHLKAIAIMMMLCLHLFNRDYKGLFQPLIFVGQQPLSYYISLFCDACVPVFAFVSGYGLYFKYRSDKSNYLGGNRTRIKKLYINYWIIILLFPVLLGFALGKEDFPGSWLRFLLNWTAIDPSYNGAWWFFTTYVLFVVTSSFWFRILESFTPFVVFGLLLLLYFIGFYFRIFKTDIFSGQILHWFHRQAALYFCTLFQFMLGAMALRYNWNGFLDRLFPTKYKSLVALVIIVIAIIAHAIVPNFIVAPFTGLVFIFSFVRINLGQWGTALLDFLANHATNIWLVHMFFYMIFFPELIYGFTYPVLIFTALVALCVVSSYVIMWIERQILIRIS